MTETTHANPPGLILQPRDREVLVALGENSILDTEMIHAFFFAGVSHRRCRQRLSHIAAHGLTRTLKLTLWTGDTAVRAPTVHCLTDRGAEVVRSLNAGRPLRVSKGEPQPATIHHRLEIVRTKLVLDAAFRNLSLPSPQWILEQDRDPAASNELPPSQRRVLYHAFSGMPRVTCQPDMACRFVVPKDITRPAGESTEVIGFFEIDCSSEGRKQIRNKLPGYARLLDERTYTRYFAASEKAIVRVFWICRNEARVDSLCTCLTSDPVALYCRFATREALTPSTALTSPIWRDPQGKRREILRLPPAR